MHAKAQGRRILTVVCVIACVIPVVVMYYTIAGGWEQIGQWMQDATFMSIAVVTGLLVAGTVWWKGAAAIPEVILVPAGAFLICQSAGVCQFQRSRQLAETQPPALSITGYEGIEVRCNDVLLGKTPLRITLDEFAERVAPAEQPPTQEAAVEWDASTSPDSLTSVSWSAFPFDPFNPESEEIGRTTDVILKRFAASQYFWTFKIGDFVAATDRIHSYQNNNDVVLNITGWETVRRHANALRTLAIAESVDPLAAYAEYIDAHPPLRQELSPPVSQNRTLRFPHSHELERFSKEPLEFEAAVIQRDWRWIARANDPKSVPLLKLYLDRQRKNFGDDRTLLTFRGNVLAILMESEQPEIQRLVRKIMTSADWTHHDLLEYYVERQLQAGANREELTSWLASRRSDLSNHFLPLLIRIAGSNFAEVAGPYSNHELLMSMQGRSDVPDVIMSWLAKQWREAPSGELSMAITKLPRHPVLYAAVGETDLSTATHVRDFIQIVKFSRQTNWMGDALSEAAVNALAKSSDPSHISELARFLEYVPTDIGLAALEKYSGPENEDIDRCKQQVRTSLKSRKEVLESELQLARDLLAGTKSSRDLVNPIRFEWKDGTYVRTQP